MVSSYTFTLRPEKNASYSRIQLLVVLLHLITFIIVAVKGFSNGMILPLAGILLALVYLFLYFFYKKNERRNILMQLPVYFFVIWWLASGVYWMAALVLVFSIFSAVSAKKIRVSITAAAVVYQSFPERVFEWEAIDNIVLKDGLLTIDLKSNKIIQQLIEDQNINEAAFNSFCKYQLQATTPDQ